MSGILEQTFALVQQIAQDVAQIKQHLAANGSHGAQQATSQQATSQQFTQGGGLVGGAGLGQQAQANVTPEMILGIVNELVSNASAKEALQRQLSEMGIASLPDAQPHHYPELYQRFSNVKAQFTQQQQGGGLGGLGGGLSAGGATGGTTIV